MALTVSAYLETLDGRKESLKTQVYEIPRRVRMFSALKTFGLFFAMATGSVLIPAVHFFSVPLLFVIGVVSAIRQWLRSVELNAQGDCPVCHAKMEFHKLAVKPKLTEYCPQCRHQLFLKMLDPVAQA